MEMEMERGPAPQVVWTSTQKLRHRSGGLGQRDKMSAGVRDPCRTTDFAAPTVWDSETETETVQPQNPQPTDTDQIGGSC
jgi:hypothetical protein